MSAGWRTLGAKRNRGRARRKRQNPPTKSMRTNETDACVGTRASFGRKVKVGIAASTQSVNTIPEQQVDVTPKKCDAPSKVVSKTSTRERTPSHENSRSRKNLDTSTDANPLTEVSLPKTDHKKKIADIKSKIGRSSVYTKSVMEKVKEDKREKKLVKEASPVADSIDEKKKAGAVQGISMLWKNEFSHDAKKQIEKVKLSQIQRLSKATSTKKEEDVSGEVVEVKMPKPIPTPRKEADKKIGPPTGMTPDGGRPAAWLWQQRFTSKRNLRIQNKPKLNPFAREFNPTKPQSWPWAPMFSRRETMFDNVVPIYSAKSSNIMMTPNPAFAVQNGGMQVNGSLLQTPMVVANVQGCDIRNSAGSSMPNTLLQTGGRARRHLGAPSIIPRRSIPNFATLPYGTPQNQGINASYVSNKVQVGAQRQAFSSSALRVQRFGNPAPFSFQSVTGGGQQPNTFPSVNWTPNQISGARLRLPQVKRIVTYPQVAKSARQLRAPRQDTHMLTVNNISDQTPNVVSRNSNPSIEIPTDEGQQKTPNLSAEWAHIEPRSSPQKSVLIDSRALNWNNSTSPPHLTLSNNTPPSVNFSSIPHEPVFSFLTIHDLSVLRRVSRSVAKAVKETPYITSLVIDGTQGIICINNTGVGKGKWVHDLDIVMESFTGKGVEHIELEPSSYDKAFWDNFLRWLEGTNVKSVLVQSASAQEDQAEDGGVREFIIGLCPRELKVHSGIVVDEEFLRKLDQPDLKALVFSRNIKWSREMLPAVYERTNPLLEFTLACPPNKLVPTLARFKKLEKLRLLHDPSDKSKLTDKDLTTILSLVRLVELDCSLLSTRGFPEPVTSMIVKSITVLTTCGESISRCWLERVLKRTPPGLTRFHLKNLTEPLSLNHLNDVSVKSDGADSEKLKGLSIAGGIKVTGEQCRDCRILGLDCCLVIV